VIAILFIMYGADLLVDFLFQSMQIQIYLLIVLFSRVIIGLLCVCFEDE
jgi:hypothetical protein